MTMSLKATMAFAVIVLSNVLFFATPVHAAPAATIATTCDASTGSGGATITVTGVPDGTPIVIAEVFPNGGYDVLAVYQHADPYVQQIPANRPRGTTLTVSVEGTVLATATICAPSTKDGCKDGGWVAFGFKNQGECVALIERGAR